MLGVFAWVYPIVPTQSHKSSTAKKITLGGESLAKTDGTSPRASAVNNTATPFISTYVSLPLGDRLKHLGDGELFSHQLDLKIKESSPGTGLMQKPNGNIFSALGKTTGTTPVHLI